jgi:hypothetical protein
MSKQKDMTPSQTDLARRRILRGMATTPVVMTLASGTARAAASSLVCIDNSASALQAQVVADNQITQVDPPTDPRYCARINQLQPTTQPSGFFDKGPGTALMDETSDPANHACVIYVEHDGSTVTGISTDPSSGSPITASCYTSFM